MLTQVGLCGCWTMQGDGSKRAAVWVVFGALNGLVFLHQMLQLMLLLATK
jgi:hypothetical protein